MRTLFRIFWALVILTIVAIFHYTLPQKDIVRVVDTYEKRIDFGENSMFYASADVGNDPNTTSRDVFFIQTIKTNGKPMVYRNEDTGWGWPPYFKFDSSNLQAEATDNISTGGATNLRWVKIRHYGWRSELMSIFPNAISVTPVAGPDVGTGIPWGNIIIITIFLAFFWAIYVRIRRFRENRIDPLIDGAEDGIDSAKSKIGRLFGRG